MKRFLSKFKLLGRRYKVEYEYIHFICINYGKHGHRRENCLKNVKDLVVDNQKMQEEQALNNSSKNQKIEIREKAIGP